MTRHGASVPDYVRDYSNYIDIESDVEGFDFLNFNLDKKNKQKLVKIGIQSAEKAYLKYTANQYKLKLEALQSKITFNQKTVSKEYFLLINKELCRILDGSFNDIDRARAYPNPLPDKNKSWHLWELKRKGNYYLIINKESGKALDAGGDNGNKVYLHESPNENNNWHLWELTKEGDYYLLINKESGKALDAGGDNGNKVYLHESPNEKNDWHLWRLIPLLSFPG